MSGSDAEERQLLADALTRFMEQSGAALAHGGFNGQAWKELDEAGFAGVGVDESHGGAGGALQDALVVTDVLAHGGVSLPVGDHAIVAGWLCARAGWSLSGGVHAVVLAPGSDLRASISSGGVVTIDGTVPDVPWASAARRLMLVVKVGGTETVCAVDPTACRIGPGANQAGEPRDEVTFAGVAAEAVTQVAPSTAEQVVLRGGLVRAAQMAAAARRVLELTAAYVSDRHQFGRPLAAFQVVRHQLAVLAAEVAVARAVVVAAGRPVEDELSAVAVMSAKIRAADAATEVARIAHQLHGAIGTTEEHELGRYTQRLRAWRDEYGRQRDWEQRLGRLLVDLGPTDLWPSLTGR